MVYPTSLVEEQVACMVEFSHLLHLQLREQKCPEITQGQWLCPMSSFVQDAFSLSLALFFPQEHTLLVVFEFSPMLASFTAVPSSVLDQKQYTLCRWLGQ